MGLSKISNEDQDKEKEILNQLFQYSDRFESTVLILVQVREKHMH